MGMASLQDDPSGAPGDSSLVIDFAVLNPCKNPEDIKAPNLQCLYGLLLQISLHPSFNKHYVKGGSSFDVLNCRYKVQLAAVDIISLSKLLFTHLDQHSEVVFSSINSDRTHYSSDTLVPMEDMILLLKSCMVILPYIGFDEYFVTERTKCLLRIFERSCSPEMLYDSNNAERYENETKLKSSIWNLGELDTSLCSQIQTGSPASYLCSILEVFVVEILVNRHVGEYFKRQEFGFLPIVLEAISAHFLLTMSSYGTVSRFLHFLYCPCCMPFGISTWSVKEALSMLSMNVISTAPHLLQAHVLLLVSNCIWISVNLDEKRSVPLCLEDYISAFEYTIDMYNLHMPSLKTHCHLNGIKSKINLGLVESYLLNARGQLDFHFCIKSTTDRKIKDQIGGLVYSYQKFFRDISSSEKFDILSTSTTYVQEIRHVLDESCRDNITVTLNCIIKQSLSNKVVMDTTCKNGDLCQQELFLLAGILKFMGCILFRIVDNMKNVRTVCGSQILIDDTCKKLNSRVKVLGCFELYELTQPIQKALLDFMETHATSCKEIRLILVHFVGILVFAFNSGHDFLWKSCIFMLMAVMNLLLFEEGNLDSLTSFLSHEEECSCKSVKVQMGQTYRQSSQRIASNFEKIRRMHTKEKNYQSHPRKRYATGVSSNSVEAHFGSPCYDDEETYDIGVEYLRSMGEASDYADLVDFVVYEKGRDYSTWMKNRLKYREWRCGRLSAYRRAKLRKLVIKVKSAKKFS